METIITYMYAQHTMNFLLENHIFYNFFCSRQISTTSYSLAHPSPMDSPSICVARLGGGRVANQGLYQKWTSDFAKHWFPYNPWEHLFRKQTTTFTYIMSKSLICNEEMQYTIQQHKYHSLHDLYSTNGQGYDEYFGKKKLQSVSSFKSPRWSRSLILPQLRRWRITCLCCLHQIWYHWISINNNNTL